MSPVVAALKAAEKVVAVDAIETDPAVRDTPAVGEIYPIVALALAGVEEPVDATAPKLPHLESLTRA